MNENLENVRGNAWSFPELKPPADAKLIGTEVVKGETFYYYYSSSRGYLYETKSGYKFKARIAKYEHDKKRKIRRKKGQ